MTPFYAAVALVFAYPLLKAVLLRATQGTRDELASVGRELLTSPDISEDNKQFISDLLNDVFDWRFMAFACFEYPKLVWLLLTGRCERVSAEDNAFLNDPRVSRFFDLHQRAVAAAAPLWSLLFFVIAIVCIAVAVAFIGFSIVSQLWIDTAHHVTARVPPPLQRAANG